MKLKEKIVLGALTCTRGSERKIFKQQLNRNIEKQELKVNHHIVIDDKPTSNKNDIFKRMKAGVQQAVDLGVQWLYIFEDDDYYTSTHTSVLRPQAGLVMAGISSTVYYHIVQKAFRFQKHEHRASLFATAFNPAVMLDFFNTRTDCKYLDVELWQYARVKKLKTHLVDFSDCCTGIKHGVGLCGGLGHKSMSYSKDDIQLTYLKTRVDNRAFEFYKDFQI